MGNALRLAPAGSRVRVAGGRSGDWVWMAVEDQGPGIPPEEQDLVFQRFWRGDKRRSREAGRSGLGLTIVRQIAEGHRGQVRVTSNEYGGSTFTIWLPAGPAWSKDATDSQDRPPTP
jgi:signal transduction histidine kinase